MGTKVVDFDVEKRATRKRANQVAEAVKDIEWEWAVVVGRDKTGTAYNYSIGRAELISMVTELRLVCHEIEHRIMDTMEHGED